MNSFSISVIIPTYNREGRIARAIQSVLDQTVPVLEIIVVDDASTDNTVGIANQFCKVRVVSLSYNLGAQAARAKGIESAKGQWIAFLDSDDFWLPHKLELQLQKARQGFDVVHGPCLVRKNGQDMPMHIPPLEGDSFARLLGAPATLYPSLLVNKACFDRVPLPNTGIVAFQEWDLSLSLSQYFSFGYVSEPLFVYEVQGDSISQDIYRGVRGYEQVVCRWWPYIIQTAGLEAGMRHYFTLASQAWEATGLLGFCYYLSLGAKLTGKSALLYFCRRVIGHIKSVALKRVHFLKILEIFFRKKMRND